MNEDFLHFVWKYRLYSPEILTTDSQRIEVIHPGYQNTDAGPDFSNSKIKIGDTLWAGNVEIHMKSSDWYHHGHEKDAAYANVILHVVFENDKDVAGNRGTVLPALELKGLINEDVYRKYFYYLNNKHRVPCENDIGSVESIHWKSWTERLFIERMERKNASFHTLLKHNGNSLAETFYQVLAGNFGFKTNEQPFRMLARVLPVSTLAKHRNNLFQLEAMMFGCAGLLDQDFRDDYPNQLLNEFRFLKSKFSLTSIDGHLWKFLRLRPTNFPTIRISQFAALVHKSQNLMSHILEAENVRELEAIFKVNASAYWDNHYTFDKEASHRIKTLGGSSIENLILNSVVQFLFFYAKVKGQEQYHDRAINMMMELKPEQNHIVTEWEAIGIAASNAFDSQALIELKNSYCRKKRCLDCNIGTRLLRSTAG